MTKVTFKDGTMIVMNTPNSFHAIKNSCLLLNKNLFEVSSTKQLPKV